MEKVVIPKKYGDYINKIYLNNQLIDNDKNNYIVGEKIAEAYLDAERFDASEELIKFLFYQAVRFGYSNVKEYDKRYSFKFIDEILSNDDLKQKILTSDCNSEFYSVIKDIIPYAEQLFKLMREGKSYLVLKKYQELLQILNEETLCFHNGKDFEIECQKRYPMTYANPTYNQRRIKNKHLNLENVFDIKSFPKKSNASFTCSILLRYFHEIMLNYYENSGYMYRPVTDTIGFYQLGNIGVLTYTYDNEIGLSVANPRKKYKMDNIKFWEVVYSNSSPKYIIDSNLKDLVNFNGPIIIAPADHIDEAFISYITHVYGLDIEDNNLQSRLTSIGFPVSTSDTDKLLTSDYQTFYKNPKEVEILKVSDITKYSILNKLKNLKPYEREKYIKTNSQSKLSETIPTPYPTYCIAYRKKKDDLRRFWWHDWEDND